MGPDSIDLLTAAILVCIGIAIGIMLDHWVLPAMVDVLAERMRRGG